jgi:hypothetical protein
VRAPYLVCRRHCACYEECREVLDLLTAAEERAGRLHPIAFVLAESGCPLFLACAKHVDDAAASGPPPATPSGGGPPSHHDVDP